VSLTVSGASSGFTLAPTSSTLTLAQNFGGTIGINVTDTGGFTGAVNLSVSGLPSGVSSGFSGNTLILFPSATATVGSSTVTVTGTSGSVTAKTSFTLVINAGATFSLSAASGNLNVTPGASATDAITLTPANGFTGTVTYSATGLPAGATASFSPASSTGGTTLTIATGASTPAAASTITISATAPGTGNSNPITNSTNVTLTVGASTSTTVQVNLGSFFNTYGIFTDGTAVTNGGLGNSYAYSATALGASAGVTWNGLPFSFGTPNQANAVAGGTTITLPSGYFTAINFLASRQYGNAKAETFTVVYSDGSRHTYTQDMNDWFVAQPATSPLTGTVDQANAPFESTAVLMPYLIEGSSDASQVVAMYGYSFPLDPGRAVASLILPADTDVRVYAITLSGQQASATAASVRPVNLDPYFNVAAISTDGNTATTAFCNQNVSSAPYTYAQSTLGNAITWNGSTFILGAPNGNSAVSNATVPLPAGSFGRLDVLAARTYGSASETFTVTYTDGSTSTFTQGISDWFGPANGTAVYPGQSTAVYAPYLHDGGSGSLGDPVAIFAYSFALNPAKTVQSVTLPADGDVGVFAMNLGPAATAPAIPAAAASVTVATNHNDTWRTGLNSGEAQLTPATVANLVGSNVFGKLGTITVDEEIDAQPLVVPGVSVSGDPNAGTHDVVYVVTENNTIYAIDPVHLTVLASRNLGAPVNQPQGCGNTINVGILSTPVINPSANVMYLMAYVNASSGPQYQLHEVSLSTLADVVPYVVVSATANLDNGTAFAFNASAQRQRPGLLLTGGQIVAGFSSFCDEGGYSSHGWVLSFSASTLALNTASVDLVNKVPSNSSNTYYLSSVWMSGNGIPADEAGNIYFATGNTQPGTFDPTNNIAESVVKLNPTNGSVLSYFTPGSELYMDEVDEDLSGGGVLLFPSTTNTLAAIQGKDGLVRVLSRANLGGQNDGAQLFSYVGEPCWCAPAYFNDGQDRLVTGGGNVASLFTWQTGSNPGLLLQGTGQLPSGQDGGTFTTVSNNAGANSIIWAVPKPEGSNNNLYLMAFQATPVNGSLPLLYFSLAGTWSNLQGNANVVPTVANGKVYVGSYKQLAIYGFGGTR
jgi:hypothetical protein